MTTVFLRGWWRSLMVACLMAMLGGPVSAATVIYDSIPDFVPSPEPPPGGNVDSWAYAANLTSEFGDNIVFAPGPRALTSATVTMSNWAKQSDFPTFGDASGYTHPLTLNLYNVDHSGPNPAVGSLIYSTTQTATIPWKPATWTTLNGIAFNFTFSLPNVLVPDEIIYGLAFNTSVSGPAPLGVPGPYDSLNFGLGVDPAKVGTDVESDALFMNSSDPTAYTDGGAGGVGTFRRDTGWDPNTPAIRFEAVPEPATVTLLGIGIAGIAGYGWRKRKQAES